MRRSASFWIALLTAVVAFVGTFLPGSWDVMRNEPGVLVFSVVLSSIHALPFAILAVIARSRPNRSRGAIVASAAALVAEGGLLVWAYSILDTDAQAGLVYVFATPIVTWGIAGCAAIALVLTTRRPKVQPIAFGCEYCADSDNRYYEHVARIAFDDQRGLLLQRCPKCGALYEQNPQGEETRRLTEDDAQRLFPGGWEA